MIVTIRGSKDHIRRGIQPQGVQIPLKAPSTTPCRHTSAWPPPPPLPWWVASSSPTIPHEISASPNWRYAAGAFFVQSKVSPPRRPLKASGGPWRPLEAPGGPLKAPGGAWTALEAPARRPGTA